jgi:uncharacterized surface protein with fasciclin (FAS1) repeats
MRISRTFTSLLAAAVLATVAAVPAAAAEPPSVADVLAADGQSFDGTWGDFDIVERAALTVIGAKPGSPVAALADPGAALTVFAPTDRAFRNLVYTLTGNRYDSEARVFNKLVSAVTGLVGPDATIDTIEAVLLYHVVPGAIMSSAVPGLDGASVTSVGGQSFKIVVRDSTIRLRDKDGDARNPRLILSKLDIPAGNSVIHAIDRVLRPIDLPDVD